MANKSCKKILYVLPVSQGTFVTDRVTDRQTGLLAILARSIAITTAIPDRKSIAILIAICFPS